ncbi:fumarylacetoacetate hydrolase family protein [Adhaeribacter pallidiroseus]|uniref:2-dehydro-3-deoxy-D-arabinonate dehydratase n=1 Tax=Adhaeribacter pallidiroseus TaxID=2072847 RepID=A0A369QQK9_9BACT|nr:fumarylacetoacetate hydrolase family protein [Adhaeribacter pallidiroseus]RDC64468.1 2-dehydro-3-deoxy-D-arabinonate dehydratase [Adhaeribacter pallidiroseus]
MKIYRLKTGILIEEEQSFYLSQDTDWDKFINQENLYQELNEEITRLRPETNGIRLIEEELLVPIVRQEIWAAGVTYYRSKNARMEESKDAGGGDFYDKVYDAERPEIFFKATAARTVGHLGTVHIRQDSTWDVPEPELTLFINSKGQIAGYTIGNDMSSRSIEGENPLYLPQAKTYDNSAAIGPCIYLTDTEINKDGNITLEIARKEKTVFSDTISINQIKRTHQELVEFLFRECSFSHGAYLMTGTGIVPPNDFTLKSGDEIRISIDPIGTLVNYVR